jgi:hypothetical protein
LSRAGGKTSSLTSMANLTNCCGALDRRRATPAGVMPG